MAADLYQRAIARAAEILGGRGWLAVYLGTDVEQIKRWSAREPPPLSIVIALMQVLQHALVTKYTGRGITAATRRRNNRNRAVRALRRGRK